MLKKSFMDLFNKAQLTNKELEYFMEDIEDAKQTNFKNAIEYYKDIETQYCKIEYARPEWKETAKTGLNKILSVLTK
jgi:hypothetical protein